MAAITVDSKDLEVLLESSITNRTVALNLLNQVRAKNGKAELVSRTEVNAVHPSTLQPALFNFDDAVDAA